MRRIGRIATRALEQLRGLPRYHLTGAVLALAALGGLTASLSIGLFFERQGGLEASVDFATLTPTDRCIAQAVYFEARGEPFEGRMAVAQVIQTRIADTRYPNDACAVVFQNARRRNRCQFSFACDGMSDRPRSGSAWQSAVRLARLVNTGRLRDLTGQATHYHADYVSPPWAKGSKPTVTIGRHRFYRPDG